MNLYLSAIGFSDMDSMKESRFIKAAVRQCIDEGYILKGRPMIAPTSFVTTPHYWNGSLFGESSVFL